MGEIVSRYKHAAEQLAYCELPKLRSPSDRSEIIEQAMISAFNDAIDIGVECVVGNKNSQSYMARTLRANKLSIEP